MDLMKLVHIWAVRVARSNGMDWRDLLGAAWEGLARAQETYDPAKGANFATYATYRIRGSLSDYLRNVEPKGHRRSTGRKLQEPVRRKVYSLDVREIESDIRMGDAVGREDNLAHRDAHLHASEILHGRELELVRLRLDGCNDREIAIRMGISESRVSQLRMEIGDKLVNRGHLSAPTAKHRRHLCTTFKPGNRKRAALPVSG
jgi:RNA polymerase sigma factor (sigma-70 family)